MNKYSLIFNMVKKSNHFVSRVTINYYYYLVLVYIHTLHQTIVSK